MDTIDEGTITRDGITYRVRIVPDYEASTADADCYSPSDVAAFERGEWQYVGVIVVPVLDGIDAEEAGDSLWAVEFGDCPAEAEPFQGGQHEAWSIGLGEIVNVHPVPDMIPQVRGNLENLMHRIARALAA